MNPRTHALCSLAAQAHEQHLRVWRLQCADFERRRIHLVSVCVCVCIFLSLSLPPSLPPSLPLSLDGGGFTAALACASRHAAAAGVVNRDVAAGTERWIDIR